MSGAYVRDDILIPRVRTQEFREPLACGGGAVFGAVEDYGFCILISINFLLHSSRFE